MPVTIPAPQPTVLAPQPTARVATPRPPTPAPIAPTAAPPVPGGGQTSYTVKPGDRLYSIGRQFGVNPYTIAQANGIGAPYLIHPGQILLIPAGGTEPSPKPEPGPNTYTVKPGDTVYSISRKFGKSPAAIINANNLTNPSCIVPGQVLKIP